MQMPTDINEVLARNLRRIAQERQLNTVSLAKACGLSQRTMSIRENP